MKLPSIEALHTTRADFPERGWKSWEARRHNRVPDGSTIDTDYLNTKPCCIHCATWVCAGCWDFRRSRASRAVSQYCPRCGGIEGFFIAVRHVEPHESLPRVPYRVPRLGPDMSCAGGDPCPGTGCPACCPVLDPCYLETCTFRCSQQLPSAPLIPTCQACGSTDPFQHNQLVARGLIQHKWNEEEVHVPEEAAMSRDLTEEESKGCAYSCLADGLNYEECPVHGNKSVQAAAKFSELKANKQEVEPLECDWIVRHSTLETPNEYCGLPVEGENAEYCPMHQRRADIMEAREKAEELKLKVVEPEGADCESEPKTEPMDYARREAMEWAVRLHEKSIDLGKDLVNEALIETAEQIYAWLKK